MRGMGSIYKRGSIYWVKYSGNRESSHSDKITVAKKLLSKRVGEIAEGKLPGIYFDRITFDELADDFITDYRINKRDTLNRAKLCVRHLSESFGGMRVTNIRTDKIKSYIDKRMNDGMSNASINRELAALKRMFHLGTQSRVARGNFTPRPSQTRT